MAENQEVTKPEREIPVFAVLKNNCILKNIYLLDNPPSISSSSTEDYHDQESEMEEILVVGRHPDCTIKLEHPSISRFHLRLHSKPSSRSFYVTDLSSVHGTWISGKKVDPGVRIKMNEGDTLQLGGSSRLYRLHWVPLSRAYDVDNPFVPQLDAAETVEEEETEEEIYQDVNNLPVQNDQIRTLRDNLEGLELLFSDENLFLSSQKLSPSAPRMPEELYPSSFNELEVENKNSPGINQENAVFSIQACLFDKENSTPEVSFPSPVSNTASQKENMESSEKRSNMSIWSRRGKCKSVQIETGLSKKKSARISSPENHKTGSVLKNHLVASPDHDEQFTPDKENCSPDSPLVRSLKSGSILTTPNSSVDLEDEVFTPDKENMTPNTRLLRSMKTMGKLEEVKNPKSYRSSPLKGSVSCKKHQAKTMLLPRLDTENQHKKVLQQKKSTNSGCKSHARLKKEPSVSKAGPDRDPFRPLFVKSTANEKANSKPSLGEVNERGGRFISYPEFEEVVHLQNKNTREENKRWTIIVDTACLLNKNSRKELQLLRGLKGTSLIIPRIVVRELDCMLRRGSLFRSTSQVSAALQWIEDCMANTKWWIHVQSSAEEGRLTPPTPPASPHWFSEDKSTFSIGTVPFSPYTLHEIVTPTAEDHILESALLFKRLRNDGQLVLLSDDVALKIKAMAEGVICETAEEFRRSLVNPFSERFLYTDSSPRGPTWSCVDDAVLKEKYYPSPSKKLLKSSGEGAKGLKLVLLHNSNFRQIASS